MENFGLFCHLPFSISHQAGFFQRPPGPESASWQVSMRQLLVSLAAGALAVTTMTAAVQQERGTQLDKTVQAFLDRHRGTWRDLNVPESDGRALHDLIVKQRFTRALEIGTSTGHSGVWIAWALAKTGGSLTTIEIDPNRHQTALANFKEAGLASLVDARLGDAHQIVVALPGPFDFVFSDADKDWYKNYFVAVWPRVAPGGCFTAHNVSGSFVGGGIRDFLRHLETLPDGVTTMDKSAGRGSPSRARGNDPPVPRVLSGEEMTSREPSDGRFVGLRV